MLSWWFCLLLPYSLSGQQSLIDSLKSEANNASTDSIRVFYFNELSWSLSGTSPDEAIAYADSALALAESNQDTATVGTSYCRIALALEYKGLTDSAIQYYLQGLELRRQLNDTIGVGNILLNIGAAYYYVSDYESAIDFYLRSIQVRELVGDSSGISQSLNNLGVMYRAIQSFDEAITTYKRALKIREQQGDSIPIGNTCFNLSVSYREKGDFENALRYASRSEAITSLNGSPSDKGMELVNLGVIYHELGRLKEANEQYAAAEPLFIEVGDEVNLAFLYHNEGILRYSEQRFEDAVNSSKKGLALAESHDRRELMKDLCISLARSYKAVERNDLAYAYMERYANLKDSLISSDKLKIIQDLEAQYKSEVSRREIAELTTEQALTKQQVQQTTLWLTYAIGFGLLMILLAILLFYRYRAKRTQNRLISENLRDREMLLKEIHHRVKNNLQVISSLLFLQSKSVDDEATAAAINEGQSRVQSMMLIHENLYLEDNLAGIAMPHYVDTLLNQLIHANNQQQLELETDVDVVDITLDVDTVVPLGLILNELVINAFKYAFAGRENGTLTVRLGKNEGQLLLQVADDGQGYTPSEAGSPDSFGMRLVHSLARKLKAEVTVHSEQGTTVIVAIAKFKEV